MEMIIISLLVFSILLFIVSLFLKDPLKIIKEELDEQSMQHIQELYQIKKKLRVLEEELLAGDGELPRSSRPAFPAPETETKEIHAIIKNQVLALARQGLSAEQIGRQASLTDEEVRAILVEFRFKGEGYE